MLIQRIAELVRDKKIEGISDLRDESDRDGVRVVIELKKGVIANVILNKLYRYTPLQSSYGVNALALTGGRPKLMGIKEFLSSFVKFRIEIITNRTKFDLLIYCIIAGHHYNLKPKTKMQPSRNLMSDDSSLIDLNNGNN